MIFLTVEARDSGDMTGVRFLQSVIAMRQSRVRDTAINGRNKRSSKSFSPVLFRHDNKHNAH